ncbi:nuclear cap-binding protein subunit 2-like [Oreochromis niloticus]|uniref:nuclear cap-binding protein subunit 2-like n=1 Tax=Oreochromis niloticus TaxID=8128 RepID=UPI000DF2D473|nr:nuclear cap-binding protein subunit 2-like [Oreochromis niloticus]
MSSFTCLVSRLQSSSVASDKDTTRKQIEVHKLFSKSGDVTRIIIGLDETKKTACGFCFVEYYTCADAEHALRFINGTRLDNSIIRTDWDASRMKAVRSWQIRRTAFLARVKGASAIKQEDSRM